MRSKVEVEVEIEVKHSEKLCRASSLGIIFLSLPAICAGSLMDWSVERTFLSTSKKNSNTRSYVRRLRLASFFYRADEAMSCVHAWHHFFIAQAIEAMSCVLAWHYFSIAPSE